MPNLIEQNAQVPAKRKSPPVKILIVDDDENFLTVMEMSLTTPDRTIIKARSGGEALRCLLHDDFAVILLDVRMPGLDGFETAALIRQRERSRYTPIIFISAFHTLETDIAKGGFAKGTVDYLIKPVMPRDLKSKIELYVNNFHVTEQLKWQAIQQNKSIQ